MKSYYFIDSEDEDINNHGLVTNNVFGVPGASSSNKSTPSKSAYVEPSEEDLKKSRQARIALQSSDPFYLKGNTVKSVPNQPNVSDIPVQKIDLEVPLHTIPGLASTDQYLGMKNGKKDKKEKKKKKKKGKQKGRKF